MADLTQAQEASLYRKDKHRKGLQKLKDKVKMLRVIEFATLGGISLGLGLTKAWKPEWSSAFSGWGEAIIDGSTAAVGFVIFAFSKEKANGNPVEEIGGGMFGAGLGSLMQFGGRRLYGLIAGA